MSAQDFRFYLRFYLPLAVVGLFWLSGNLATNFVLLANEHGVGAFATFTLAQGLLAPIHALFVFTPQMSTVMARSRQGRRSSAGFLALFAGTLVLLVFGLAASPLGPWFIGRIYRLDPALMAAVRLYVLWLSPLFFLEAVDKWCIGQLIQAGRTATASTVQGLALTTQIAILAWGFTAGWAPMAVIIAATWGGALVHGASGFLAFLRWRLPPEEGPGAVRMRDLARYFLPLSVSSLCFALGKVALLALLTRASIDDPADGAVMVAAFGLLMSLNMLFNLPVNNLRHCFTTYGQSDPLGVRRFHWIMSVGTVALAALFVITPAAGWFFGVVQGASGATLQRALSASPIVVLFPLAIAFRAEAQGRAMVHKRTGAMAIAALARLALVVLGASVLLAIGRLDETSASLVLAAGFATEAVFVWLGMRTRKTVLATAALPARLSA